MEENLFLGVTEYKVYYNLLNAEGEMPVSQIAESLINAASHHAYRLGVGFNNLIKNNHTWVLARMAIEMKRYPKAEETLVIETWIEGFNKVFTTRNMRLLTSEGEELGFCRTIWSVIDYNTREAQDLMQYRDIPRLINDKPCPIEKPGRIPAVIDEDAEIYKVRYSDLDINRHMTSSKYIEHMLDRFSLETFDNKRVGRFEIQYINEALYDDEIKILKQKTKEGEYITEMKNSDGNTLCKSRIIFI